MLAEKPEDALQPLGEVSIGQVEHRANRASPGAERVKTAGLHPVSQLCKGPGRPRTQSRRGQGECERQPVAVVDDPSGGPGFGGDPVVSDDPGEQVERLGVGEGVEQVRGDTVQARETAAAGDQDQARGAGRDEVTDLHLVGGVVQQNQGVTVAQPVPEHHRPLVQTRGDLLRGHGELPQKRLQDGRRVRGREVRVEATQVHVQLHLGEVPAANELVRRVDGELGLADTGHALDRGDHHRLRTRAVGVTPGGRSRDQPRELLLATREGRQIRRELAEDPSRTTGLRLGMHAHARGTPPADHVLVRTQGAHHRDHEVLVEPTPARLEHVRKRRLRHLSRRPQQRPDPVGEIPQRRSTHAQPQLLQHPHELGQIRRPIGIRNTADLHADHVPQHLLRTSRSRSLRSAQD